ncbi:MAG: OmpA family protein [Bacteroidota bacterium]
MKVSLFLFLSVLITVSAYSQEKTIPETEKNYIIKSIYFGGGSNRIDEIQLDELYQLMDSIPKIETFTISIHSHTDNIGGKEYNEWLSQKRSEAVINKLVDRGVFMEMIKQRDFGQLNPVYDNSTWLGRMKNRRVDIIFWPSAL